MIARSAGERGRSAREDARAGLYVHVPFCATRCTYCDFSSGALSAAAVERYLLGVEREIARRAPAAGALAFTSVFFGGGTPSALSARHFRRVWRALTASFTIAEGAEITLEANPESVRGALLEAWAEAGVNRLSMGAQSFVSEELEALGRIHSAERPAEAFALARAHGFRRLSLDLMFGFPGHTIERWRRTVEAALALEPEHLSAYCFIPEAGTPLGNAVLAGERALPAPEEHAESYEALARWIEPAGYTRYETSNFCRAGGEARHNLVYWLRRPYVGLGPSPVRGPGAVRPRPVEWRALRQPLRARALGGGAGIRSIVRGRAGERARPDDRARDRHAGPAPRRRPRPPRPRPARLGRSRGPLRRCVRARARHRKARAHGVRRAHPARPHLRGRRRHRLARGAS
ncbi:MAG: radical SAM family heme chaperone HemW [Candidatus Eisenbacteria bacterium]|uniref:Heme chaperone HemW n=1 Tax=Eiseniibacteriota bacterium TaxID=2212470 RepID=A0A538SYE4_UNCEI|nr:MAG: radical SAM family heme chaperone HemW [Candidatus Eisenbacteria bacterium]